MDTSADWDTAFYEHYQPFVRAYVSRRVPAAAVDDLVAQVFEIAWRRRTDLNDNALPWLYRTARNVVGNRYRSDAQFNQLATRLIQVPMEPPPNPDEVVSDRDLLVNALRALSSADRELLLLVAWEGLSVEAAANALEISPGAATVRLHRARRRLELQIEERDHATGESK